MGCAEAVSYLIEAHTYHKAIASIDDIEFFLSYHI